MRTHWKMCISAWTCCPEVWSSWTTKTRMLLYSSRGSSDVKAVGSLIRLIGNRSTMSPFSQSMMMTHFRSSFIFIFCVQIPLDFSIWKSLRSQSFGLSRAYCCPTENVARCSSKYEGPSSPPKSLC
uniref:Putative secreted protein n=1 Tax=Ixodes ricinus TaxID=34613 RepID=A0A147BF62_IXORI